MRGAKRRVAGVGLLLAASLALAGGVAPGSGRGVNGEVTASTASSSQSPRGRRGLEERVRRELVRLPYYSVFDNLEFRVEGYRVTLGGQVVRPTLRHDAEKVVKRIEGIESVENRIEVLPVSFHDDDLRRGVYRALYSFDSPLHRYSSPVVPSIHIIVKHGHVALVGVVDNEADRNIAYLRARSVPGSFSVTNNLRVAK